VKAVFGGLLPGKHARMLEADYSSIGSAATGFSATAGRLRNADVAGPFSAAQDGLVGSKTSQACLWVATRLGASAQVYADRVEALSQLATATVDSYQHTDAAKGSQFRAAAR
jgi:hypothetical protein